MDLFTLIEDIIANGDILLHFREIVGIIWESLQQSFSKLTGKEEAPAE